MRLYRQDSPEAGRVWIDNEHSDRVAEMDVDQLGPVNALQLGAMFAAAPELLKALQMMLDKFGDETREGEAGYDAVCAALAAIAHASGN